MPRFSSTEQLCMRGNELQYCHGAIRGCVSQLVWDAGQSKCTFDAGHGTLPACACACEINKTNFVTSTSIIKSEN
jgi:hypothetical protein